MMTGLIVTGLVVAVLVVPYLNGRKIEKNNDELAKLYSYLITKGIEDSDYQRFTKHTRDLAKRIDSLGGGHVEYVLIETIVYSRHMRELVGKNGLSSKDRVELIIRDELRKLRG